MYRMLPDVRATQHGLIRVVDESGEDDLYPTSFFFPIRLSPAKAKASALVA
jgi:hypothetical protein